MGCPRIAYRRRMHYATRSNQVRKIRTPGNRLIFQSVRKRSQGPHTPWVLGHKRLGGTQALNAFARRKNAGGHAQSVSRAYGGVLSADQVRDRVIRAFLVEEQRVVRRMALDAKKYKKLKQRRDNKNRKKKAKAAGVAKAKPARVGGKIAAGKTAAGAKKGAPKVAAGKTAGKK